MHFLREKHNKPQTGSGRRPIFSIRWMISLMCLLIIFLAGIFSYYHRPLSAGSVAETKWEPFLYSGNSRPVQDPDLERMARSTDKLAAKPSLWPTGGEVTSVFGWRVSPFGGGSEFHQGIDIANSMGTPVVATADGKVVQSGFSEGYGNLVQIDHGNSISTIYGHNSYIIAKAGQSVKKGQIISYLGNTGRSTGPHLHYEIRVNGIAVDPIVYMVQY